MSGPDVVVNLDSSGSDRSVDVVVSPSLCTVHNTLHHTSTCAAMASSKTKQNSVTVTLDLQLMGFQSRLGRKKKEATTKRQQKKNIPA